MRFLVAALMSLALAGQVIAALNVTVSTQETGKITSYFGEYWVVNVDGNVTISNPTDRDLFDIEIRYDILSLSLIEGSGTNYFRGDQMVLTRIPANSSVTASYNIVGITLADPALIGKGVLYTGMTKFAPIVYSDTFGQLQKANLENASLTGRPGRLISVELDNPTGFQYTVNSMRVIKTPDIDPNQILAEWDLVNASDPVTIDPDNILVRDILDKDSAEGQVYWLQDDLYISHVSFVDNSSVIRYTQQNLTIPPEFLNYTINLTNETNRTEVPVNDLYVRKLSDRQVVTLGEPVTLSFIVNNFAPKLIDFTISDTLPPGFLFVKNSDWNLQNGKLIYSGQVSGRNAVVLSYQAQLNDSESAGLDFFDAGRIDYTADGTSNTVYSNTVPFIRQFLPSQKLYVQKKLTYQDQNQIGVTLTVQNLGASAVQDLLVKEYLGDNDVFSQITQQPDEKGMWTIPELKPGGNWEVSYVTTNDTAVTILPGVFGVPSNDVLKSLVTENVISNSWQAVKTAGLELIGIALILCLPLAYYILTRKKTL